MARERGNLAKQKQPKKKAKKRAHQKQARLKQTCQKQRHSLVPKVAFSVTEFCQSVGISRDLFYELERLGLAPDSMKLKNRRLISIEARERWTREREAAEAVEAAARRQRNAEPLSLQEDETSAKEVEPVA
jgi:hypothetical protein